MKKQITIKNFKKRDDFNEEIQNFGIIINGKFNVRRMF